MDPLDGSLGGQEPLKGALELSSLMEDFHARLPSIHGVSAVKGS